MNYRHIYHAGCICDVVKHAGLTLLLRHLRGKERGFAVLDTHAGIGLYDLSHPNAQKTSEAEEGIKRLLAAEPLPELADYYRVLGDMNPDGAGRFYPGSPLLTRRLLRSQDRLIACELHAEDMRELKRLFCEDKQVQVHHRDGYEALGALLPPPEKRGLVFIDPPFETGDEFARLVQAVQRIHQRWPQAQGAIWYPIKERPAIWRFHEALAATQIPKLLCAEFIYAPEVRHDRLNGSGTIFLNPPWKLDEELTSLFPALHKALQTLYQESKVIWLTPEKEGIG